MSIWKKGSGRSGPKLGGQLQANSTQLWISWQPPCTREDKKCLLSIILVESTPENGISRRTQTSLMLRRLAGSFLMESGILLVELVLGNHGYMHGSTLIGLVGVWASSRSIDLCKLQLFQIPNWFASASPAQLDVSRHPWDSRARACSCWDAFALGTAQSCSGTGKLDWSRDLRVWKRVYLQGSTTWLSCLWTLWQAAGKATSGLHAFQRAGPVVIAGGQCTSSSLFCLGKSQALLIWWFC